MKRKRNSWWEVTVYKEQLLYCNRRWVTYEEFDTLHKCGSSHAQFNTKKRAFRNAAGLLHKTSSEVLVLHWFYKNGKLFCQEWVRNTNNN